jgi:hypothetical protein
VTRKLKPVETDLSEDIQDAVLDLPVRLPEGELTTVGELIEKARESLRLANAAVQNNALIQTTAAFLMKQDKRRGNPSILVRMDGSVVLRVTYGEEEDEEPAPEAWTPPESKPKLPTLPELRERAERLRVDISDLGRQKLNIIARLDEAEAEQRATPVQPDRRLRDEVTEADLPPVSLPR